MSDRGRVGGSLWTLEAWFHIVAWRFLKTPARLDDKAPVGDTIP